MMSENSQAACYIVFNAGGDYLESGFTPDGTIPQGGKLCTREQHDASGQWTKLIDDTIVIGDRPAAPPAYVPAGIIRQRLQQAGLWTAAVTALMSAPEKMLWFTTLEQGILPGDPIATPFLEAIGADPAAILASP
jgi:hypothetical protein